MNKLATLLATTAVLAITAPSYAADVKTGVKSEATIERDDDGSYVKKTNAEKTSANGVKSTAETEVDFDHSDDGDATKTTTTKETRDPKGLFNRDTVKTKTTEKLRDGKLTVEHEKSVNGDTVVDKKSRY
jgi:hypothetical protein